MEVLKELNDYYSGYDEDGRLRSRHGRVEFLTARLHYAGTDMATNYMRQAVDEMDEQLYEQYLRYHFAICEREDMVGVSHHILDIFRKN